MPSAKQLPHMTLVAIGQMSSGKSTLLGHFLYLISSQSTARNHVIPVPTYEGVSQYSWVMDKLKQERERGMTVDITWRQFKTPQHAITVINTPGHVEYIRNMITGTSLADCALMVVSAAPGEFEASLDRNSVGQTQDHIIVAYTMGVRRLLVAVSKMDATSPEPFCGRRFQEIRLRLSKLLSKTGFKVEDGCVTFVPVSGLLGDNLVLNSNKMPWFPCDPNDPPTLLAAMDALDLPSSVWKDAMEHPFRMVILDAYKIGGVGTVISGRVASGSVTVGQTLCLVSKSVARRTSSKKSGGQSMKHTLETVVNSAQVHHCRNSTTATAGQHVSLNIKNCSIMEVNRGDVCGLTDSPNLPTFVKSFLAEIKIVFHPGYITTGYTPVLDCHAAHVPCRFEELLHRTRHGKCDKDESASGDEEDQPGRLDPGDVALVRLVPKRPLCVEPWSECPPLARFVIRDRRRIVAFGKITQVTRCGGDQDKQKEKKGTPRQ